MGLATVQKTNSPVIQRIPLRDVGIRFRWYFIIPLLYVSASIILLWPLVIHVRTAVADMLGDPLLNAWTLRWVQHAMVTQPTHLYDGNMFAPNLRSLAFSELLLPQAIMAWPLWLVSHDALLAYNLSVLVTYPLCAIAMYALCRSLGAVRGAAFIAGLAFAFAPFRIDNNAHIQVLSMQWMPLAMLAIIRYMQRPTGWRFAAVSATVMAAALSSVYYTMMFGTALMVFLIVEACRQRRKVAFRSAIGLLAALAIGAAIVAAADIPYLTMRHEQNIVRTLDEAYDDSAHKLSYFTVTPGNYLWHRVLPTSGPEHSALFPGVILLVLTLVGFRYIRRPWMGGFAALGLVSIILSFGPTWGDKTTGTPLPYRLLYQHIIGYQGIRGPDRFAAIVLLALCPFASLGATWLWKSAVWRDSRLLRLAPVVTGLCAVLVMADCATRLLPTMHVDRSATALAPYHWLAAQSDTGIVAEFPVAATEMQTSFYSTYHWHDVIWGHSGFIPAATYQLRGRFIGHEDFPGPDDLDALADMGVGTLLIHRSAYPAETLALLTQHLRTSPEYVAYLGSVGDCDIYHLRRIAVAPPISASVTFKTNPAGNLDRLSGQLTLTNPDTNARMLYTHGSFDFSAEIRDAAGKHVSSQPESIVLPAVISKGTIAVPLTVVLPKEPGTYTIDLHSTNIPILENQPWVTVTVISLTTLPHLAVNGAHITSPPLYEPGESVAIWMTTKSGTTLALPDTMALPDGTLNLALPSLPAGAAQIVAHGKSSGVELWVTPP